MKTAPRYIRNKRPEPSFFGHVFYWTWRCTPKHGLPDRSWILVAIVQFAYFLFPFALCTPFFSDDTVRMLYEADDNLKYLPIATVWVIMIWRNLYIYNERKYQEVKEYYMQISPAERIRRKRQYLLFIAITVIMIVIEVWLFYVYSDRWPVSKTCTSFSENIQKNSFVK